MGLACASLIPLSMGYIDSSKIRFSTLRQPNLSLTLVIVLEPHASRTKYTALVMRADSASRVKHEQMGFHDGWGAALDQLVADD